MSSTFSELAATSLIERSGAQPESDRFLIASVPGEDLADTFRAVLRARECEAGLQYRARRAERRASRPRDPQTAQ